MCKYLFLILGVAVLSSCSGSAKAGYVIDTEWNYVGTHPEELACVEVNTNEGTYNIDQTGCV